MSAGITNPRACAYIDQRHQPARALALGTDRPAHASPRNATAEARRPMAAADGGGSDGGGSEAPP